MADATFVSNAPVREWHRGISAFNAVLLIPS